MKGLIAALGLALALGGCGYVSFSRRMSDQEIILREQIRSYYSSMQAAFAAGNPQGLASLFWPSITHPMSHREIEAWAKKFFAKNKNAHFRIRKLDIESIGPGGAVVTLTYRVETPSGKGNFAGTERDTLTQDNGHWYISAWDKLSP